MPSAFSQGILQTPLTTALGGTGLSSLGTALYVLRVNAAGTALEYAASSGTGTVTSVDITLPTGLVVTGNPITSSGTLAIDTDIGYVIPLQSSIDEKAPLISPTFDTSITGSYLTASEILITDASKNIISAPVATYPSLTELTYLKGVTSSVQTQLGTKVGALGAIGATANANGATLSGVTLNLEPASASFGGVVTTGTQTFAGAKTFSNSTVFSGGLSITGGGAFSNVAGAMQLVGSSTIYYTSGVSTGTTSTLATDVASARFIVGTGIVGTFTSGTHPIIASTAFKPQTITNNGATVTNTATTYIESAMTGGTNNYALWVDSGTVRIDDTIELGAASDTTLSRSAAGVIAVEGVVIPSISSTNTLTNKRVTPRTGTTTSSATPTINTDNVDFYSLTAQTVDITSFTTNLSGTPTDGQTLWIAITGTAARAIGWGASFEASTVALPTTTVSTNRLDARFVWNAVTNKWRIVGTA